ncbi:hypothetical protein KPH14_003422 [Odynerus spinipes]|uniref:Uncharacterized protein n=1 Tax=Odynerus spinipes TaxID=1348599 RepID=A0AAD9RCL1_9HYME|nr:hypothetical protein KPH14_003422 [Odynerus spinipes]
MILPYKPILTITQMVQFVFVLIMSILDTIHYYIEETRDPRTQSWPLISIPALVIPQFSYLYFIYVCGPRYMKDKPPYNLKTIIRFSENADD